MRGVALPFTSERKEFLSIYLNGERDSWKVLYEGLDKVEFKCGEKGHKAVNSLKKSKESF